MKKFSWSEEEIASRVGASTVALLFGEFSEPLNARHMAKYRELGITKVELEGSNYDCRSRKQVKEIATEAANHGLEIVSVHGPSSKFSSAYADGITEQERRLAVAVAILMGETALAMGASTLVCHFGTTESSEQSAHDLLDYFKGTPLKFGAENVGKAVSGLADSDFLSDHAAFVDRVNSDRFGLVVDLGHARDADGINPFTRQGAAYETIASCGRRIIHLHLHDAGEGADDHLAPMDGAVRWFEVLSALHDIGYGGALMFESIITEQDQKVLEKIAAFPRNFMRRYDL